MSRQLPRLTVAQAFVIWRVPISMPISREMLMENIEQDIEDSAERCEFKFSEFSRRATPQWVLKFLLKRNILSEQNGLISRNKRTARYVARLPENVVELIDGLPVCDPLTLLAGTSRNGDK